jgi:hypothetical protein
MGGTRYRKGWPDTRGVSRQERPATDGAGVAAKAVHQCMAQTASAPSLWLHTPGSVGQDRLFRPSGLLGFRPRKSLVIHHPPHHRAVVVLELSSKVLWWIYIYPDQQGGAPGKAGRLLVLFFFTCQKKRRKPAGASAGMDETRPPAGGRVAAQRGSGTIGGCDG